MTPQTQAEQKARDFLIAVRGDYSVSGHESHVQELTLLIQKADALDWVQENHFTIMACHQPKTFMCVSMGKPSGVNTSLLSAINQARKEQG
jgi:hypothetical protein